MKKTIILSAIILAFSSFSANAGSSFHFGFFAPAPIYIAPPVYVAQSRPVYIVEEYRPVYRNPYPRYNYQSNYWYYDDYDDGYRHHNKHHRKHHRKHDDD